MTRVAAVLAMILGGVSLSVFGLALLADFAAAPLAGAGIGLLILVSGVRSWLGHPRAPLSMVLAVLPLLTVALAQYFQTYRFWPHLFFIVFSSFTFGLGLLGIFLDRIHPDRHSGPAL